MPIIQADLDAIKLACETFYDSQVPIINKVEEQYYADNNKYWQGIVTPEVPPDDLKVKDPDLKRKPTDQPEDWDDVFKDMDILPVVAGWPCSMEINVYEGPVKSKVAGVAGGEKGWGYTIVLLFTKEDPSDNKSVEYKRSWGFGPQANTSEDWDSRKPGGLEAAEKIVAVKTAGLIKRTWDAT